jgi:hypothetical protein
MINHLRTCLLNASPANTPPPTYPGEEYVPPAYQPKTLAGDLLVAYQLLFGNNAGRSLMNWRLRELTGMLHASELEQFVRALDSRITYLPLKTDLMQQYLQGPGIIPIGNTTATLSWVSPRVIVQTGNRLFFQWVLSVINNTQVTVTQYDTNFGTGTTITLPYTVTAGLSSPITLPDSGLQVVFTTPAVGSSWQIQAMAKPILGLPDLVNAIRSGLQPSQLNTVFGPVGTPEPFKTFRNLWERHDQLPYQLGGFVLALGYQINALGG